MSGRKMRRMAQAADTPVAETCMFVYTCVCKCSLPGWSEWVGVEGSAIRGGGVKK